MICSEKVQMRSGKGFGLRFEVFFERGLGLFGGAAEGGQNNERGACSPVVRGRD